MPDFRYYPPVDSIPATLGGFVQEIRVEDRRQLLAFARWHAPTGEQGVVQLLELTVVPERRRQGFGGSLLRESIRQAASYHRAAAIPFRRFWVSVEQKSQVVARAFLTQHGFHHVATIANLVAKQDALIYVKSMD